MRLEFGFNTKGGNTKYRKWEKKATISKIRKAMHDQLFEHGLPKFRDNVKIVYTRYGRIMDTDNLYTSAKWWIDRLTEYGVIQDDRPIEAGGHVDLKCISEKGSARTVIEIIPLNAKTPD